MNLGEMGKVFNDALFSEKYFDIWLKSSEIRFFIKMFSSIIHNMKVRSFEKNIRKYFLESIQALMRMELHCGISE